MAFRLLSFRRLLRTQAQAVQGSSGIIINVQPGSVVRALLEANASVALWMQWLIVLVLRRTRASTSTTVDLDSWVADFGVTRLPASAAVGSVTFSRLSLGMAAFVPVGASLRSADGTQTFTVGTNASNAAWTGTGYSIAPSVGGVTAPVIADATGAAGNVQAGAISLVSTAIAGVDTVTNLAPLAGGLDAEADDALRSRFVRFVDSRARATVSAIAYAIISLQQGLSYSILENTATDGTTRPGFFTVAIDDGTGSPTSALMAQIFTAVDAVRPVGTSFAVVAPQIVTAVVSLVITAAPGYSKAALIPIVAQALLSYIDALGIGHVASYGKLFQVAFGASPGVANVQSLTVNGAQADLGGGPLQTVRTTLPQISVA